MKTDKQVPKRPGSGDTSGQRTRFVEAARQLGADEDEDIFRAKLAQIARQRSEGEVPEPD